MPISFFISMDDIIYKCNIEIIINHSLAIWLISMEQGQMPLILFACKTLVKLCTNQLSNTIFTCLTITQPANSNFNSIKYTERKIIATRATRRKLSLSRHFFFFLRRGLRLAPKKKKKKKKALLMSQQLHLPKAEIF